MCSATTYDFTNRLHRRGAERVRDGGRGAVGAYHPLPRTKVRRLLRFIGRDEVSCQQCLGRAPKAVMQA